MSSNREFIAAFRARQVTRDVTPGSFAQVIPFPVQAGDSCAVGSATARRDGHSFSARVDIGESFVLELCKLDAARLKQLWPAEWQWERDWRTLGGATYFNRTSLPALVGMFSTNGETEAAAALLKWLTPAEAFSAGSGGCPLGTTAAPARKSYLNAWEDAHQ